MEERLPSLSKYTPILQVYVYAFPISMEPPIIPHGSAGEVIHNVNSILIASEDCCMSFPTQWPIHQRSIYRLRGQGQDIKNGKWEQLLVPKAPA